MRRPLLLLAVAALLVAASPTRGDYMRAYDEHTRDLVIYYEFQTALILRGTLLTEPFRHAMATERQRLLDPTPENHAGYLESLLDDGRAYHEVVFSADSGMPEARRFGTTDDGWVVRLLADGVQEELVTLFQQRRPNPLHRTFYPHYNRWSSLWVARFARTVDRPDTVVFHVGSGYGHGELRWEGLRAQPR